jgi:hypothetical protein
MSVETWGIKAEYGKIRDIQVESSTIISIPHIAGRCSTALVLPGVLTILTPTEQTTPD